MWQKVRSRIYKNKYSPEKKNALSKISILILACVKAKSLIIVVILTARQS